ncbi:hypothetical protein PED39_05485 [Methanomassiliicoccales archaeon LGM-RCC1]|nr:hypothetical protein PED39_05485 [Methanomassiliicoccales archaeon LGM-RCC1]
MTYLDSPVIMIGTTALPSPAYGKYSTRLEELVKAERNVSTGDLLSDIGQSLLYSGYGPGELIKKHIAWKYTLEIEWHGLTYDEKTTVMNATAPEYFMVTFLNLDTDEMVENKKMYRGNDQTVTGYGKFAWVTENGKTYGRFEHYDIKLSLIEL